MAVFSKTQYQSEEVLVYIPGGPGDGMQTESSNLGYWLDWYSESGITADFIVYTPRGVPGSKPYWFCDEYELESIKLLALNLSYQEELKLGHSLLDQCLGQFDDWLKSKLKVKGSALALFGTVRQADDVLLLLEALGYERWHLWGVSYGSRVALVASEAAAKSERYKNKIQTQLLDSPYPLDRGRQSEWASLLDNALALHQQHWQRLNSDQSGAFIDYWYNANALIEKIQQSEAFDQVNIEESKLYTVVDNWHSKNFDYPELNSNPVFDFQEIGFYLNKHRLQAIMFFTLYDENLLERFYEALQAFVAIDSDKELHEQPYSSLIETFVNMNFDPAFSSLVFYATECTDNERELDEAYERAVEQFPQWGEYLALLQQFDICKGDRFTAGTSFQPNYVAGVPTMIVSGIYDPVTPSSWAYTLSQNMERQGNPVVLVNARASHSVIRSGACSIELVSNWLEESTRKSILSGRYDLQYRFCNH